MGRSRQLRFAALVAVGTTMTMLGSGCGVLGGESPGETVLIGVDLELTGDSGALGTIYHNALQLRVEQVNEQRLLGDRRVELVVHDNRADPATSQTNLERLASNPEVAAIITGGCDECVVAAADTIEQYGVPTIALGAASAINEPVGSRQHLFKLGPNADHNASVLVQALAAAGAETVGLVAADDPYGADGLRELAGAADRAGIEIVVSEQVGGVDEELAGVVGQIAGYRPEPDLSEFEPVDPPAGPDAVVAWTPPAVSDQLAVQLRDAGYEGPLFLDAVAAGDLFLSGLSGAALTGATMVFTETMVMDEVIATSPAKAARKTWFRDYTARYGTYHAYSSFAADALLLLAESVNRTDGTSRAQLRDSLEGLQLDGLSGPLRMTPTQHTALMPQALVTLTARGDRWRLTG